MIRVVIFPKTTMNKNRCVVISLLAFVSLVALAVSVRMLYRRPPSYQFLEGHTPVFSDKIHTDRGFRTRTLYSFNSDYSTTCPRATFELLSLGYIGLPARSHHKPQKLFLKLNKLFGHSKSFVEVTISGNSVFDINPSTTKRPYIFPFVEKPGWVSVDVSQYDHERSFRHYWKSCVRSIVAIR